eukprot:807123-Prorocentrum_minimum.AAC.1
MLSHECYTSVAHLPLQVDAVAGGLAVRHVRVGNPHLKPAEALRLCRTRRATYHQGYGPPGALRLCHTRKRLTHARWLRLNPSSRISAGDAIGRLARTGSSRERNSTVPTAVEGSIGVNTKWFRGEITTWQTKRKSHPLYGNSWGSGGAASTHHVVGVGVDDLGQAVRAPPVTGT